MFRIGTVNIDGLARAELRRDFCRGDVARYTWWPTTASAPTRRSTGLLRAFGAGKRYTSLEEMAGNVDIAFIQGCDWDRHLALAEPL